jgi:CBS domain containing-hemolysin-like protein
VSSILSYGVQFALLLLLLAISAYCSSAETAITSIDENRLRYLIKIHKNRATGLSALLTQPNEMITALLVMNNLVNVSASALATLLFLAIIPWELPKYLSGLIVTGVMTISILIIGEITPKTFAKNNAEQVTLAVINQIYLLTRILRPVIRLFHATARGIGRVFGKEIAEREPLTVSDEQIETLVDVGEEHGLFDEREGEMIKQILDFGEITVAHVMVPRTEMKAIEVTTPLDQVLKIVAKERHSRFPVYEQIPDNIVGTLYAKDLLRNDPDGRRTLRDLLHPTYYTPLTKPIKILLREFQKDRVHQAVVVDEYGGVAGLVTLEDILEEIVGEIEDEFDRPITLIKRISANEAIVNGDTEIKYLNKTLDIDLPDDEWVTISGLILYYLEDMPHIGEEISVGNIQLTVKEATEREIISVRVKINPLITNKEEEK